MEFLPGNGVLYRWTLHRTNLIRAIPIILGAVCFLYYFFTMLFVDTAVTSTGGLNWTMVYNGGIAAISAIIVSLFAYDAIEL